MYRILCPSAFIAVISCLSGCMNGADGPAEESKVSFTKDIKPVLERQCINCHNSETLPGKLSFENAAGAFINDSQGRAYIVPGKPAESRLFTAAIAPDFQDLAMPPVGHRVAMSDTDNFRQWILEGAEWPDGPEGTLVATEKALE